MLQFLEKKKLFNLQKMKIAIVDKMIWAIKTALTNSTFSGEIIFKKNIKKTQSGGIKTEGIKFPSNERSDKTP